MVERVKQWLAEGNNVKVLTARVSDDPDGAAKKAIQDWTEQHLGQRLDVTDVKDSHMTHLYDDRAVPVERNTGKLLAQPQPEKDQAVTPQVAQGGTESAKVGQPDRRVNRAERQRVDQMSPEEMRRTLLTSDKTGLPNK